MLRSNCCFLTCIQVSQEAGKVVWDSHLFKNFPKFIVIHTVKGFSVVHEAEVNVFLEFSYFFDDPTDVGNLISAFSFFFFLVFIYLFIYLFIFRLYITVLVLPNIKMNPPQVYMCSPFAIICIVRKYLWPHI